MAGKGLKLGSSLGKELASGGLFHALVRGGRKNNRDHSPVSVLEITSWISGKSSSRQMSEKKPAPEAAVTQPPFIEDGSPSILGEAMLPKSFNP